MFNWNNKELFFDSFGMIYKRENDELFYLTIDKNDDISWDSFDVSLLEKDKEYIKYSTIEHLEKKDELQQKTIEQIKTVEDIKINDDDDFYPEAKYFKYNECGEDNEYSIAKYEDDNIYIKPLGYTFEDISLYDTIIINDKDKTIKVVFAMESMDDTPSYRITFYTSGYITLNIIGSKIKKFNF